MVKVCKIWCNDVYMYILCCDIFWWKLIDRNFFNKIFNTRVVSQGISLFSNFNCFAHDYLQTDYSYTVQPRRKTQNPQYYRGQNQQFADRRSDSMWTMIVDKFYHFYHHRGIMLNANPSWCRAQWTTTFLYNVLCKPTCTCTKFLDRIKFTLKNQKRLNLWWLSKLY